MWWNTPGWMYGWWIMPFFGIIFLVLVLLIVSRFVSGGGFCGRPPADRDSGIEELRKEIKTLREEIRELKDKVVKGSGS